MKLQLVVVGLLFGTVFSVEYNYNRNGEPGGVSDWGTISTICNDDRQSPINLDTNNVFYSQSLIDHPFLFDNYYDGNFDLRNNGHSVELLFSDEDTVSKPRPTVTGSDLPGEFKLFQIHFHWGSNSTIGSEHALGGAFFPMEMHMVHYNTMYPDIRGAISSKDGLAVLGFFFEISDFNNDGFDPIIENLNSVRFKGDMVNIGNLLFKNLMAGNLDYYYRYLGSLTTPSCYETVTWTVFNDKIQISENQMAEFRKILEGERGDPQTFTSNNFRPLQNLYGRTVYTTDFQQGQFIMDDSSHLQASLISLLLSSLLLLLLH